MISYLPSIILLVRLELRDWDLPGLLSLEYQPDHGGLPIYHTPQGRLESISKRDSWECAL